jgi:hypothetical protein
MRNNNNSLVLLCLYVLARMRRHSHHLRNRQLLPRMAHPHLIHKDSRATADLLLPHLVNSLNPLTLSLHNQVKRPLRNGISHRFRLHMDNNHPNNLTHSKVNGVNHSNPLMDKRRSHMANLTASSLLFNQMFVLI